VDDAKQKRKAIKELKKTQKKDVKKNKVTKKKKLPKLNRHRQKIVIVIPKILRVYILKVAI
jgi:hypothetical protein